jgi:hypothetical protein
VEHVGDLGPFALDQHEPPAAAPRTLVGADQLADAGSVQERHLAQVDDDGGGTALGVGEVLAEEPCRPCRRAWTAAPGGR